MIDLKKLEKDDDGFVEKYKATLKNRGDDPSQVDQLLSLNQKRKKLIAEFEEARAEQNKVGPEIARLKKEKKDATELLQQMQKLSSKVKELEAAAEEAQKPVKEVLLKLPNILHESVPVGSDEGDNEEVRSWGEKKEFSFQPKEHWEVGENLGIIDFDRAGKIAGSRFAILKGQGARLERALIQFMMDVHSTEHGYEETIPPFIVNSKALEGTGQFPKFKEDVFHLSETDYHLIPTAEVPVTNYHAGEILSESDLPKKYIAYSPCFRSEAGSYGKDTKGLIRQHQFNKVEMVKYAHPDQSQEELEKMTADAEKILQLLEIPYRTVALCSGDIGFGAYKTYDIEVWLPGQKKYREISSCSNCWDFQARRANIRFRPGAKGKPQFVHTLNGSGLAVGRTWIAILENYQNEDGSFDTPDVLKKYM